MADPVSSVAYTIEASLRSLHGRVDLLLAPQVIVIAVVDVSYWQLAGRFLTIAIWRELGRIRYGLAAHVGCGNAAARRTGHWSSLAAPV